MWSILHRWKPEPPGPLSQQNPLHRRQPPINPVDLWTYMDESGAASLNLATDYQRVVIVIVTTRGNTGIEVIEEARYQCLDHARWIFNCVWERHN